MEEENESSYVEEKYVSNELISKVNKECSNSRSNKQITQFKRQRP